MSSKETVIKATVQVGMDISDVQSNAKAIQNTLKNFKMPAGLEEQFEKTFKGLEAEITKVQTLMQSGFKTKSDVTGFEKSKKNINNLYNTLQNLYSSFKDESLMMNVDFNTDEIKQAKKELQDLKQQLSGKVETDSFRKLKEQVEQITSLSKSGAAKSLQESFAHLNLDTAKSDLDGIVAGLANFARGEKEAKAAAKSFQEAWNSGNLKDVEEDLKKMPENMKKVASAAIEAKKGFDSMGDTDIGKLNTEINELNERISKLENLQVDKMERSFQGVGDALSGAKNHAEQFGDAISNSAQDMYSFNGQMEQIKHRVQDFFSLTNSVMLFRRAIQSAFESVKELDAAMTETAVVTDFSVGDMWDKLPEYTNMAKELGATTLGAYETMTLFYQQGLENDQVMQVGTETMKMARIAGLEYADATDLMTAALRGFNMEVNAANATRINDVYSELAAITAADTNEIATAMTKTASIAASANMEFETTAAFLSQIIETTREPAETAGTAMKTIIARFTEMKKATSDIINVDGEEVSVNKVEAALKSAGVQLRDTSGEFRDLDDVFLELAQNWDHLDLMTQRYIATTAAGSRQQSRFIAMMSNYDRTMELVDAAYDSSGASAAQFAKTQDSLEAKLNKLKDTWQEFTLGLANNKAIKTVVDALTKLLDIINKATDGADDFSTLISRVFMIMGGLKLGKNIFDKMFSGVTARFLSEGKKGAEAFNKGLEQGIKNYNSDGYFKQFGEQISGIKDKIASTKSFNKRNKQLLQGSTDGMEIDTWYNSMSNLMNPNDFAKQMPNIATTMENSLREALNQHNLSDEGKEWTEGLIKNFIHRIKNNGDVKQALQQMKEEAQTVLESEDSSKILKEDAEKVVQIDNENIKVKKEHSPQQQKKTGMNKANAVAGGVMAIGMAGNLIASSMEEAGVVSKEVTDTISTLSSGLSTAGSMAMMLGAAFGPVGIAIGVAVGLLSTFVNLANQAKEKTKEMYDNNIDIAKEYNEETKAVNEQVKAYEDLYKIYKENGEETEELKTSKEELIESLELEKYGVNALTSSYEEVAEAARQARMEMLETNSVKQGAGLQGAIANALTEGEAAAYEGTGWTGGGTGFKINLGAGDDYSALSSLIEEIAAEEGVTGLSMKQNTWGNMEISGLENSPEAQRIWMKIISQVMSKYQEETDGDSTAYSALMEYWGNVASYYESAEETYNAQIDTQKEIAREDAMAKIQGEKIVTYQEFHKAIDDVLTELKTGENKDKYKDLSEEDKIAIAKDAVTEQTGEKGLDYGTAYTQLLKLDIDTTEYDTFVQNLTSREIEFIAKGEVKIDEDTTQRELEIELGKQNVVDTIFGTVERQKNLLAYAEKLVNGEEITEDEKTEMTKYIQYEFGDWAAREFELSMDNSVSSQLNFLQKAMEMSELKRQTAEQAYLDTFDDQIELNIKENFIGSDKYDGKSRYEHLLGLKSQGKSLIDDIEGDKEIEEYKDTLKKGSNIFPNAPYSDNFWVQKRNQDGDQKKQEKGEESEYQGPLSNPKKFKENTENFLEGFNKLDDAYEYTYDTIKQGNSTMVQNFKTAEEELKDYDHGEYYTENMINDMKALEEKYKNLNEDDITTSVSAAVDYAEYTDKYVGKKYDEEDMSRSSEEMKDYNYDEGKFNDNMNAGIKEIQYFVDKVNDEIYTMEHSIEYFLYNIYGSKEIQDYNKDDKIDYYDVKELVGGFSTLTDQLKTVNEIFNPKDEEGNLDTDEQNNVKDKYFDDNGNLETDIDIELENDEDFKTLQEMQNNGITIKLDDKGNIIATVEKIGEEDIDIEIEVNDEQLKEAEDFIEDFEDRTIAIEIELDSAEIESAVNNLAMVNLEAENLANALSLLDGNNIASVEDAKKIAEIFPYLFEGAINTADGIQFSAETIQRYTEEVQTAEQEAYNARSDWYQTEQDNLQTQLDAVKEVITEEGKLASGYANTQDAAELSSKEIALAYAKETIAREETAQSQSETTEKLTNDGIDSSAATALAATTSLSEINEAVKTVTQNMVNMWVAYETGEKVEMMDVTISSGTGPGYEAWESNQTYLTEDLIDRYFAGDDLEPEEIEIVESALARVYQNAVDAEDELASMNAGQIIDEQLHNDIQSGKFFEQRAGSGSGGSGGSEEKNETNALLENINKRLTRLDNSLEERDINQVEYSKLKDELLLEKNFALELERGILESEAKFLDQYYYYDQEQGGYIYIIDAFENLSDEEKNEVDEEIKKLQDIEDQVQEVYDELRDKEFKLPETEKKYYDAYYSSENIQNELDKIDRERKYTEEEKGLVGKLPEEIQTPLNLALMARDIKFEVEEIPQQVAQREEYRQMREAKIEDSDFFGTYYTYDEENDRYVWDEEKMSNATLRPEDREAIEKEYDTIVDLLNKEKELDDELYGGFIQDSVKNFGKVLDGAADAAKGDQKASEKLDKAFDELEKQLGLNENALDDFAQKIKEAAESSEFMKKEFEGFGIEGIEEKLANTSFDEETKAGLSKILGKGTFTGADLTDIFGGILNNVSDYLNFDMLGLGLDAFNLTKDIFDKGKSIIDEIKGKIEELVGYITQATQVIIDAWTNREDYLYNFLKIIEKHLQEYEKLQREDNQFQKGRTASVEDIKRNWNEQWKSLQTQLEEQQERLETRQDELNRSRWNPFQLISGWDPTSDTLYENREVKFLWDVIIGLGEAFAPFGTGAFFSQMNQLYEDYDQRVQNSYEDRLAAEQAILDIEDQRLELVKAGAEEATQFEEKVLDALMQKEQEQIDELTRLNEAITEANSKLISTLQNNLEKIRQDRENEKKEEELSEKERRLAYLRQDTSGANMMEIKKLEEELEEGHEDYTDTLIDQKISELQEQNDKAAEQRQQQIELLQAQLDWNEKYGLYWDTIYGMLYTFDENGNVILKPENFDIDGNIRENSELAKILGTFSDRMGMSTWSAVLDSEELKLLGKYYGAFVGVNGVDGNWKNRWALDEPGADDPNYAYPEQEIPEGVWGVLYSMEIMFKKYFVNSNLGIANGIGRIDEAFKNAFGKLFGNEELANYNFEGYKAEQVQSTFFAGLKKAGDDAAEWFAKAFSKNSNNAKSFALNAGGNQNYGDTNINNTFTIGTVGESVSLDDMVDKVSNAIKGMFTSPINSLQKSR